MKPYDTFMIKEQAIVHTLTVKRIGEKTAFQLRLPADTKRLIGLEYWALKTQGELLPNPALRRVVPPQQDNILHMRANKMIGKLNLQNNGCAGLFYQGILKEYRNIGFQEYVSSVLFTAADWIQSTKRYEINWNVSGGLVEGLFEDSYGLNEYSTLEYELNLYFWIEKCVA